MKKTLAGVVVSAALLAGSAGAIVFGPSLAGAQEDNSSEETEAPDRPDRTGLLDELVEEGVITAEQADIIRDRMEERMAERRLHHHKGPKLDSLSEILGLDASEIRDALRSGESIADIAEANGVAVDDVVDALVAEATARVEQAIDDGRVTEEQVEERLAELPERIEALVNGERPERPEGEGHRGFGRRGPGGPRGLSGGGFGPPADAGFDA